MGTYTTWMCFTQKYFGITEAGPPQDVKEVFKEYAGSGSYMKVAQLRRFLVEFQGDCDASVADAEWIVEEVLHRRHLNVKLTRQKDLTLEDFHYYLFSVDLNPPINNQVHQDMGAPLSHYFIYTGHNSYLTGNQLSSDCSDVPIIKALKRGLRAVELDLWSNSAKDDVLVLHGWTLTTPVELIKCLRSIKEHAFSVSPYPVIITLEDHLTPGLQAKVAQMVTQTFGDMLFYPEPECLNEFPSPEELKYRIIISTTPPKEYLDGKTSSNGKLFNSQKERYSDEDVSGRGSLDLTTETCDESEKSDCDKSEHNQYSADSDACDPFAAPAYKRLIAIPARKPKGGLRKRLRVELGDTVRRLSLSEQKFEKATMSYAADVVRFTQKNILRIYPRAARVNSSNYNPLIGWTHGAQMVASNMQGYGKCLWLMHGMFRSNGGCGYVKKPDFLMSVGPDDQVFYPKAKLPVRKIVKVKLYMGDGWHVDFTEKTHSSFWSPPDLYAKVGIAGVARDKKMKKTKKRKGNGTPVWDEEFEFPLTVPELALLRIVVCEYSMSEKNYFAGQTCLPVSELRPGIHAVPLFNRKGEQYSSVRLLMRFQIEQVNIIPP